MSAFLALTKIGDEKWIQIVSYISKSTTDAYMGGVKDGIAADHASRGLNMYNKGQYHGKVTKLIADTVKQAKKMAKISR